MKTTGLNTLSADLDVDENGVITRFEVLQSGAAPGAGELRPHRLAIGTYDRDDTGRLVRTNRVELDVAQERTEVPGLVGVPRGALVLLNDDDLTYCKARLDAASLSTAIDGIADVADSLPRTLLWSAVWEMTRDALMRARDFVILAVRGVGTEDQIGVLQRVLAQLQVAVGAYAEPRLGGADRLADGVRGPARPGGRRGSRAATPSWRRCRRSPARNWTPRSWPRSPAGGTVRPRLPA